jgi:endonuclease III
MVRGPDAVDLGAWSGLVPRSALVVPLDTHVHRVSRCLGLTLRRDASWRTAEEITAALRRIDPEDPVRYDFALCHLGMSGDCPARRDPLRCAACPLAPACGRLRPAAPVSAARRGGRDRASSG